MWHQNTVAGITTVRFLRLWECHNNRIRSNAPVWEHSPSFNDWNTPKLEQATTSRAGQAGGGSFKEKNYKSKKEFAYRMCTGWPTTAMPKPSFLSERAFSRSMLVMWWPVLMWLVAGWDPKFCGWLWDDARWGNVVSCEMSCHVMWCNLMCLYFMWCDFLCCVMSRNALRCHVLSSHVMSCHLLWSDAVQWDEILWVCDAMWLVAMSRW